MHVRALRALVSGGLFYASWLIGAMGFKGRFTDISCVLAAFLTRFAP